MSSTDPKRILNIAREVTTPLAADVFVMDGVNGNGKFAWSAALAAIAAAYAADAATYKIAYLDGTFKIPAELLPASVVGSLVFIGSIAGNSVPNTAGAAGQYYVITTAGTSQSKTWVNGDLAIYNGTSGSWTQVTDGVKTISQGGTGATSVTQARTNLEVLSQKESNSRLHSYLPGLKWNGPAGSERVVAPLTNQPIGTRDFSLRLVLSLPPTITGTDSLLHITSANSGAAVANGIQMLCAGSTLTFRIYGATTSDFREKVVTVTWGDKIVELLVTRTGNTLKIYVDGVEQATTENTAGTAPNWGDTITANFINLGSGNNPSEAVYFACTLFNNALSAAEAVELYLHGIKSKWKFGSQLELLTAQADRDFSGANNWVNGDRNVANLMASFDSTGDLSISSNANGQTCRIPAAAFNAAFGGVTKPFKAYEVSFDAANVSGAAFSIRIEATSAFIPASAGQTIVAGRNVAVLIPLSTGGLEIVATGTGNCDLDNFNIRELGAVVDLDLGVGVGFQCPDRSTNKLHGHLTSTSIEHRVARYQGQIFSRALSTTGFGRLQPDVPTELPAGAIITSIVLRNTTGNAISNITMGTTLGGTDVLLNLPSLGANAVKVLLPSDLANPAVAQVAAANLNLSAGTWNSGSIVATVNYVICG